CQQYDSNPLAF
nr:immunoglobulin light chain junction region [Macaca mulatta]